MSSTRRTLERGWIAASVAYGGVRASLVWTFLRRYGVNPWIFAGIELGSSFAYGLSSARVVGAVIDRRFAALRSWGPLALVAYLAPDAYVFTSAGRMPTSVLSIVIAIFVVALVLTAAAIVRQVRGGGGRESNPPDGDRPSRLF